jgi:hypothetical protein
MADADHRLAAQVAMQAAMDAETARRATHEPVGGRDPGVPVGAAGGTAEGYASLGMTDPVPIEDGLTGIPDDWLLHAGDADDYGIEQ